MVRFDHSDVYADRKAKVMLRRAWIGSACNITISFERIRIVKRPFVVGPILTCPPTTLA